MCTGFPFQTDRLGTGTPLQLFIIVKEACVSGLNSNIGNVVYLNGYRRFKSYRFRWGVV